MSHFTRIRTQLRDIVVIKQALKELGYTTAEGAVRGYMGQEAEADIVVRLDGGFDIGFRSEGQNVTMIADVWGLKIDREHFMRQLLQRYAYLTVMQQSRQNGWTAIEEEVQSDGSIRLVMQRWA